MKIFSSISFFVLFSTIIIGQPTQWFNYSHVGYFYEVDFEEEFIWVGTPGGVLKFDRNTGEQLEKYKTWNSGMAEYTTTQVAIDHNGVKWFGSRTDGGLTRFDNTTWERFNFLDSIAVYGGIKEMKIGPNNDLWFITKPSDLFINCLELFQYNDTTLIQHDISLSNSYDDCNRMSDFAFDALGDMWIGAFTNGLIHYDGETQLALYDHTNSPLYSSENVHQVEVDGDDNIWICTEERLLKFDGANWSEELSSFQIDYFFTNIFLDEASNLNVSTKNGNTWIFARFDGVQWEYTNYTDFPTPPPFYNGNPATPIYADTLGYFWMAGRSASTFKTTLYKVNANTDWVPYQPDFEDFRYHEYSPLVSDCNHGIWSMTTLQEDHGGTWEALDLSSLPNSFSPTYIAYDKITCDLWMMPYSGSGSSNAPVDVAKFDGTTLEGFDLIGTWDYPILIAAHNGVAWVEMAASTMRKYENGLWSIIDFGNSPLSFDVEVRRILFDDFGNTWFSDENDKLMKLDAAGNWQVFNDNNSIPEVQWLLTIDASGMVWCKHDLGLVRFDGVNWEVFSLPELAASTLGATRMVEDQFNNFWISTWGREVFYWDGTTLTKFDKYNSKLSSNSIKHITIDDYGNVWFNEDHGITVFNENYITQRLLPPPVKAQGLTYFDSAQDGLFSIDEDVPLAGKKVWLYPDSIMSFSNAVGTYTFFPDPGDYTLSHSPEVPFLPVSPSILSLDMANEFIDGLDFGVWTDELPDSISISLSKSLTVCSQPMTVWVSVTNHSLSSASGNVSITFDELTAYNNSFPAGAAIDGNVASWEFHDLGYSATKYFTLELTAPDFNSIGEELNFHGYAESLEDGNVLSFGENEISDIVLCSYDPNDKLSASTGISDGAYSEIGDPLDYTIRFQNTGNYTAFKVVLVDTLDKKLDPNTLTVLGASAPVRTELSNDGVVTFTFEDINLPPEEEDFLASQGFVKFRIAPYADLLPPISIFNQAHIYFDFNDAIVTNFTQNVLIDEIYVSTSDIQKTKTKLKVYPNPSKSDVTIFWDGIIEQDPKWEVEIFDLVGNKIRSLAFTGSKGTVQQLSQGCFFIRITKGQEIITKKVVVLSPF